VAIRPSPNQLNFQLFQLIVSYLGYLWDHGKRYLDVSEGGEWVLPCISYAQIENIVAQATDDGTPGGHLVVSLVDNGILCPKAIDDCFYEMLLPGALSYLLNLQNLPDPKVVSAFHDMFVAFVQRFGSPGAVCEPKIREWICAPDAGYTVACL